MTDLALIQRLVLEKTHNLISEDKAGAVLDRLRAEYPGRTLPEAIEALSSRIGTPSWMTSIVSINETFFFRHPEQFDLLKKQVDRLTGEETLEVLCAGASSGQEAYSLAIFLEEILPRGKSYRITGLDIDFEAIEAAKCGRYSALEVDRTPERFRALLFKHMDIEEGPDGKTYRIHEVIKAKVRFICSDIFSALLGRYDLVFIRNILIYFEEDDRAKLLLKLREKLSLKGLIFIGAGELLPRTLTTEASPLHPSILERKIA